MLSSADARLEAEKYSGVPVILTAWRSVVSSCGSAIRMVTSLDMSGSVLTSRGGLNPILSARRLRSGRSSLSARADDR